MLTPPIAARHGVSRSRVRTELARGRWRRLSTGVVLTRPDDPSRYEWLEAALVTSGDGAAVSGVDALYLAGIGPAPASGAGPLVLTTRARSRSVGPVLVRRTDRRYATRLTPLEHPLLPLAALVGPARAAADAAIDARSLAAVRAIVARVVQCGACTVAELDRELAAGPRRQSHHLRAALSEVGEGARSSAEAHVVAVLRGSWLPDAPSASVLDRLRWMVAGRP